MAIIILFLKFIFEFFLPYETKRWATTVMMLIGVNVGGGVYLWLAYASTLFEHVFGAGLEDKLKTKMKGITRIFKKMRWK